MELIVLEGDDWSENIAEYAIEAMVSRPARMDLASFWGRRMAAAYLPSRAFLAQRVQAVKAGKAIPVEDQMTEALVALGCEAHAAAWVYLRIQQDDLSGMTGPTIARIRKMMQEGPLT